jgi:hypothetical protein
LDCQELHLLLVRAATAIRLHHPLCSVVDIFRLVRDREVVALVLDVLQSSRSAASWCECDAGGVEDRLLKKPPEGGWCEKADVGFAVGL